MRKKIVECGRKTEAKLNELIALPEYRIHMYQFVEALQDPDSVFLVNCFEEEDYVEILNYQSELRNKASKIKYKTMLHIPRIGTKEHYFMIIFNNKYDRLYFGVSLT